MEYDLGEHTLKVFSMESTFGTALDVTADEFSRDFFVKLAA